ncbi:MAG: two component transcriptional regulator, winged helix family [Hyphomicrobiales bacterium]|nr:two component transcriptional regulator, winged helix family [Hyphomicrobiales bacterium]
MTDMAAGPGTSIPPADDAPHLLVVDDDRRIRALLSRYLSGQGYRVTTAGNALEARARLRSLSFDLIILDVMMPGENGFEFASSYREESDVPILMLTARTDTQDRVRGLETGVDDYLAKPFEPKELSLRIASILRRMTARPEAVVVSSVASVRFGVFSFNLERGELRQADEIIRLTDRERFMLRLLSNAAGEPVSRETLAGEGGANNERTVDVQINRLRRKIETDPTNPLHLQTARGAGYRLMLDR